MSMQTVRKACKISDLVDRDDLVDQLDAFGAGGRAARDADPGFSPPWGLFQKWSGVE